VHPDIKAGFLASLQRLLLPSRIYPVTYFTANSTTQ